MWSFCTSPSRLLDSTFSSVLRRCIMANSSFFMGTPISRTLHTPTSYRAQRRLNFPTMNLSSPWASSSLPSTMPVSRSPNVPPISNPSTTPTPSASVDIFPPGTSPPTPTTPIQPLPSSITPVQPIFHGKSPATKFPHSTKLHHQPI